MENSRNVIIGIIIVVALLVIGSIWLMNRGEEAPQLPAAVGDSTDQPGGSTAARLSVDDQFPGSIVYVSGVESEKGAFVVIEKGSTVVGSQYFGAMTKVGSIALMSPTKDGENYIAKLYADSNNDGKFDLMVDKQIVGATGQPIQASFQVLENLPEKKG